jgi:hypothetical protein
MNTQKLFRMLMTSAVFLMATTVQAQMPAPGAPTLRGESPSRMQMKMDRDEFLRSHVWSETAGGWMLKEGVDLPTGIKPRAEVKAARDEFLRNNRWTETGGWMPTTTPRNMGAMSRAQVRADTVRFLSTHRWDESTDTWQEKAPRKAMR